MPPRRQPSTRTATAMTTSGTAQIPPTTTRRTTRAKSSSRAKLPSEPRTGLDELASNLSEKLTVDDTKKPREPVGRATRSTRLVSVEDDCNQDSQSSDGKTATEATRAASKVTYVRHAKTLTKSKTEESLVAQLHDKLTLKSRGNERVRTETVREEECIEVMRAINTVSKTLSAIINSGWKSPSNTDGIRGQSSKATSTEGSLSEHHANARRQLRLLRKLKPEDVDIERAALSLAGKLNTLESFDLALQILSDTREHIIALCNKSDDLQTQMPSTISLMTLPIPATAEPNEIVQTLLSSYLLHALTAISHLTLGTTQPTASEGFCDALYKPNTLIHWLPHFGLLPAKYKDSILTRAYTALNKVTSYCQATSRGGAMALYRIRAYGLLCLAHTGSGVIDPNTFWNQVAKWTVVCVRDLDHIAGEGDEETTASMTATVSATFDEVVVHARQRDDQTIFMNGRGFLAFCEYWMSFARRTNDLRTLERIRNLIQSTVPERSTSGTTRGGSNASELRASVSESAAEVTDCDLPPDIAIEGARLYALFTQTTAVLEEQQRSPSAKHLDEVVEAMDRYTPFMRISFAGVQDVADDEAKDASRVVRSFERMRRAAAKALEASAPTRLSFQARPEYVQVKAILMKAVDILGEFVRAAPHHDMLSAVLDSCFVLSRTSLVISDTSTYAAAYDYLAKAASLFPTKFNADGPLSHANYLRCLSGAFHNIAATLCQASRYDFAIRFLDQSCAHGEKALEMYRMNSTSGERRNTCSEETWSQLEDQVYRRWEILGVCHSKLTDRKLVYKSFRNCVRTFPFHKHDFHRLSSESGSVAFWNRPELKSLGGIIDRLTYIGLCDLYKEPEEVSLRQLLRDIFVGDSEVAADEYRRSIVGMLLEKQIDGLRSSIWKPAIRHAVSTLLHELLDVYKSPAMPVRRARVLLRQLDILYHAQDPAQGTSHDDTLIREIAAEAESLLTIEKILSDEGQAPMRPYYLAILKLRLALLAHRSAQTSQFSRVVTYAEEACKCLKAQTSESPTAKPKDYVQMRGSSKRLPTRSQATAGKATPSKTRTRTAKTASTAAVPATPKRKGLSSVRTAASHMPPATFEPGLNAANSPGALLFDDMSQLIDLLRATAQLLGLLGQIVTKVHVLLQARRISEQFLESHPDDFVKLSVDLAHEHVKLGKIQKGANIYWHTLSAIKNLRLSDEAKVFFLLRYAESLALAGSILKSSSAYCDACSLSDDLPDVQKGMTAAQRITTRSASLERAAIAANTFALIQHSRDDPATSIEGHLQSLRLWNRALDTLQRLVPPTPSKKEADDSNPFLADEGKTSSADEEPGRSGALSVGKQFQGLPALNGLEWRIAEGLLTAMFFLIKAYVARGSPREAEYFGEQAQLLAESLDTPAMGSCAFARIGEIQLYLGQLQESYESLTRATELASDMSGPDAAEIQRLRAEYNRRSLDEKGAQQLYEEAITMLEELDETFKTLDGTTPGSHMSQVESPASQGTHDILAPELLVTILRQNIWLLHGEGGEYQKLLERFRSITGTAESEAEKNALLGKLSLDNVYSKFQADMLLSSLTESTITLPMGSPVEASTISSNTHEIINILTSAEKLFWSELALVAKRGKVFHARDAAVSLALIRAFQVSLGKSSKESPILTARLLDSASAVTLRREVLEAILHKFRDVRMHDDMQWPLITSNGSPLPPKPKGKLRFDVGVDGDEDAFQERSAKAYWDYIRKKYESYGCDAAYFSESQADKLPANWTVVSISVTEDKNTMFVTRQRPHRDPLIICLPLKDRRENDEEEKLTFHDAIAELDDIIQQSDEGTKQAVNVRDDRDARANWWAGRTALDKRLKELLENIEFCWLGAFKAILCPPTTIPMELLDDFRKSIEQVFERSIVLRDKRQKNSVCLDGALVECFASLSPKCRDEELEDVIYFILDLYQFHGIPVASAEVDIDQAVIDIRAVLEDFTAKSEGKVTTEADPHMFLILDKNVQGVPWESIPILRGRSVSRIPSMDFLLDRLEYAQWQKEDSDNLDSPPDRLSVDPRKVFYVLNPSGDLKNTEGRFLDWLKDMKKVGWEGIVGRAPSEQQFADALSHKDLVLYFGHGGAEQYIRSHKVRHLPRCAATMLWGCSSGSLKDMGDFDRTGTPNNYMLAGCPSLVANLWDVTDRDIDKFAQSAFEKISLNADRVRKWSSGQLSKHQTSVVTAVAQSRESCKLKYLTGAAPVVYGIPFYL